MRALLFFLLVLIFFGLIMMVMRRVQTLGTDRRDGCSTDDDDTPHSEPLTQCVECGVWLPQRHAVKTKKGPVCPQHIESEHG